MSTDKSKEKIFVVVAKELTDMLRDYKALVPALVMSLFLGPIITCILPQLIVTQVKESVQSKLRVSLEGEGGELFDRLRKNKDLEIVEINKEGDLPVLNKGKTDVIIRVPERFAAGLEAFAQGKDSPSVGKRTDKIEILYSGSMPSSGYAGMRLLSTLVSVRQVFIDERIKSADVFVEPAPRLVSKVVTPPVNGPYASPFIARMLSSILVFIGFLGAIYPALDVLTGERERNTLESLVITPASRRVLFSGKLIAVTLMSYSFVLFTISGFYVAQFFQPPMIEILPFPLAARLPLTCALAAAALMLPLCLSLSVSLLSLAGLARTVQQAQGYFASLMFVAMLPLGLMVSGEVHQSLPLSLVPFLGSLISINDLLEARVDILCMFLSIVVSIVFAAFLAINAAPIMEREDLLLGVDESPARRYREGKFGRELFLLCSVLFLLMFYLSQSMVVMHHIWGLFFTQILVVFLPGLLLVYFWLRLPLGTVYGIIRPPGLSSSALFFSCLGACLMSPLTIAVAVSVATLQSKVLPSSQALEKLMEQILGLGHEPLWLLLFVVALAPGICEELLFRGVIFSLLKKRLSQGQVIWAVGGLFGLFHMSLVRLLPTGLLGVLLTWMRLRAGCIYPCMCLHACHNGLAVLLSSQLKGEVNPMYLVYLAGAAAFGTVGLVIFLFSTRGTFCK